MRLMGIDHFVITTSDLKACLDFYVGLLGMEHRETDGHHNSYAKDPIIGDNKHNMRAWNNGKVYSAPFWVGFKSGNQIFRFGYSAKIVQSLTQNVVHKYLVPTPYFIPGKEFYSGPFSYAGYNSPLSLW